MVRRGKQCFMCGGKQAFPIWSCFIYVFSVDQEPLCTEAAMDAPTIPGVPASVVSLGLAGAQDAWLAVVASAGSCLIDWSCWPDPSSYNSYGPLQRLASYGPLARAIQRRQVKEEVLPECLLELCRCWLPPSRPTSQFKSKAARIRPSTFCSMT